MPNRITYSSSSIRTIEALCATLDCTPARLNHIINNIDHFYSDFQIKKRNGDDFRTINSPNLELKTIQKRINSRIFCHCIFPEYLQGSIKDPISPRDFVTNAATHAKNKSFILADIKNFYPSIKAGYVHNIYKFLFSFSKEVSDALTALTTLNGCVPQGSPTSSYIANLVFYDTEYKLAGELIRSGFCYTRLIDDITVSSPNTLSSIQLSRILQKLVNLAKEKGFELHRKKLKTAISKTPGNQVYVTGLWVDQGHPRLSREQRNKIRKSVYLCSKEHGAGNHLSDQYHQLHQSTSGKVALMKRLGHSQSISLRKALRACLPEYDSIKQQKIALLCNKFAKRKGHGSSKYSYAKKYHKYMREISILSRSNLGKANSLRHMLSKYPPKYKIKDLLEI